MHKKVVKVRRTTNCRDCSLELPAGSYAYSYKKKNDNGHYLEIKICEDCEKYYKRKDPDIKALSGKRDSTPS